MEITDCKELTVIEKKPPVLVYSPHPILMSQDREIIYAQFQAGESLGAYLYRVGILQRLGRQPMNATINGIRVPRELWFRCYPKVGTIINLYAIVRGGGDDDGGGKNPVATIAMIALMVVATWAFGPGGAAGLPGLSAALAYTAVVIIGGLVINSLFPPPKIKKKADEIASSQFGIGGGSNRVRQNEPFGLILGVFRVFPDYGSLPYTEFSGEDQIAYFLFDFGYNDVNNTDYKVGANPLSTYIGVELQESGPDGVITLFPSNVDSLTAGVLVTGVPQQLTTSFNTVAIGVDIAGTLFSANKKGEMLNNAAEFTLQYRPVGATDWLPFVGSDSNLVINNATRKPVRNSYKVNVTRGQYEVKLVQTRIAIVDNQSAGDMIWTQMRSYQSDTTDYTGRKRVALKITASGQLNGTIDQLNCISHAKTLVWRIDLQQWILEETSNPAWWFLSAARGKFIGTRKVFGAGYSDDKIDIEGLKRFAEWCTSQSLTFNGQFQTQLSVFDLLSAIALCGRATVSWGTGKLGVVWDAPNLPVTAMFGMHNIIPGTFTVSYATDQLADVLEGQFINPEIDWQTDFVRVKVPGATSDTTVRTIKLDGRTSRTLAAEDTNLYAAQNAYRNRKYQWQTDWEGMPCSRGDVVGLTHDMSSLDYSGRFVEGGDGITTLKLPRQVPLFSAGSFIMIQRPDGTFSSKGIRAGSGLSDTLTLAAPLPTDLNPYLDPDHPPYDYRWQYGPTATPGKKVKIDSFKPVSERLVELTAIDELDIFYTAKDNPYTYVPPKPVFGAAPTLTDLELTEEGILAGNGYVVKVIVTWSASGNYQFADVRYSLNNAAMIPAAESTAANSVEIIVPDFSDITVEVTAYGNLGRLGKSTKKSVTTHIDFAGNSPPSTPTRFTIEGPNLGWLTNPEVDIAGYRIRFHYGSNFSWDDAAALHEGLITSNAYQPPALPQGPITLMLKAVDTASLESLDAAIIVTDLGDPEIANVLETVDYRILGFPAHITGGTIVSGSILADDETSFYSADEDNPRYSVTDTDPFYPSSFYKQLIWETDLFTFLSVLVGSQTTLDYTISGDTLKIEYRVAKSGPMYGAVGTDPFDGYKATGSLPFYTEFFGDPPDYQPWPGSIFVTDDQYQFRVTLAQSANRGTIDQFKVIIDAPDMEENFDDIVIALGGTRLTLTKPFTSIQNIQLTLQSDGGTAITTKYLDKDIVSGPLIKCFNAANAAVAGIIDAKVKGY